MLRGINWDLIGLAVAIPLPFALAVSWVFGRRGQATVGNVVGLGILLAASLVFGGAEYADALKFRYGCELTETPCAPTGSGDFRRISVFGFIALIQSMGLFIISGIVERRSERAHYDAQWR